MSKPAVSVLVALLLSSAVSRAEDVTPPGTPAPDWTLQGSDGKTYSSAQFKGKGFVLAWFPKAFTGGCTEELGAVRDAQSELARFDATVFMVSFDPPEKNADFAKSLNAKLVLLSDPKGDVANAYGVSGLGGMYAKRWTFYVDRGGVIRFVDRNVQTATAGKDIAAKLDELGFQKRR
ncbi:MAG TPA: peroxiredoxin [Myxococcota bacterium]|nr:peroxiredoxin [Myxococcota bacterium]